jgi:hypothetical protein
VIRGGRTAWISAQGRATGDALPCPASEEPNTACSGLSLDVSVRTPFSEPNDIVDVGATSFPLRGRVHDCRADGKRLAIGTGSSVVLIDGAKRTMKEIASQGSDRVAVADGWIARTDGTSVRLAPTLDPREIGTTGRSRIRNMKRTVLIVFVH